MSDAGAGRTVRTDVPHNQGSDYTITNFNADVALDCDSTSDGELADVLSTVIRDLIALGILNGTVSA